MIAVWAKHMLFPLNTWALQNDWISERLGFGLSSFFNSNATTSNGGESG